MNYCHCIPKKNRKPQQFIMKSVLSEKVRQTVTVIGRKHWRQTLTKTYKTTPDDTTEVLTQKNARTTITYFLRDDGMGDGDGDVLADIDAGAEDDFETELNEGSGGVGVGDDDDDDAILIESPIVPLPPMPIDYSDQNSDLIDTKTKWFDHSSSLKTHTICVTISKSRHIYAKTIDENIVWHKV